MGRLYSYLEREYFRFRVMRRARRCFSNAADFREALFTPVSGQTRDIHTKDGLSITIRRNRMDAGVLAEVWLDRDYVQGLHLLDNPVVVDIGGFIGDFALIAVTYLNASRVVVIEPLLGSDHSHCGWPLRMGARSAWMWTLPRRRKPECRSTGIRSPSWSRSPGISLANLVIDQEAG
jgi:hypothetical protein